MTKTKNIKAEITLRIAVPADVGLLAKLGRETFHDAFANHPLMPAKDLKIYLDETFTPDRVAEELADPKAVFLLAEIGGEAAGYAKLELDNCVSGITAKNAIKLKRLYSQQKFIGFGIGSSLMERCFTEAAKRQHDTIWLTVWENNLHALKFYKRWNFESCGTINFQLGGALLTDLIMQRAVG